MRSLLVISFVYGVSTIAIASAQDSAGMFQRDRNISVMERPRPEYQSAGVQRGAFVYSPELNAGIEFNDNIFATASNESSDLVAVINPSVSVATTWSRHSFGASASIVQRQYMDYSEESITDVRLTANGGIDIGRGYVGGTGAKYSSLHEPRTSAGAAGRATEPISYDTSGVYATVGREIGRTKASGRLAFDTFDYDDAQLIGGGIGDQDTRDRNDVSGEFRGDYAYMPDTSFFARVRYVTQEYDQTTVAGFTRDQDGYTLDFGASFDLGNLARGEIGLGYLSRSFGDPSFRDVDGLSVDGLVEWFPTPLTTLTFSASRSFEPAAVAGSPAFLASYLSARVDYEFRRNVILSAGADWGSDDYEGIDRTDDRNNLSLTGTYLMNRNVGFAVNLVRSSLDSSGLNGQADFEVNKILFSVVLQR